MPDFSYLDSLFTSLKQTFGLVKTAVEVAPKVDQTWEFAKAVVGPFLGVSAALLLGARYQGRAERRNRVATASLVLAQLRMQRDDFTSLRLMLFRSLRERSDAFGPEAPAWALARPVGMTLLEGNVIDLSSLGLLMDLRNGPRAFQSIALCQREHANLKDLHDAYRQAAEEVVPHLIAQGAMPWINAQAVLGPTAIARISACQSALLFALRHRETVYQDAMRDLGVAIGKQKAIPSLESTVGHRLEDLPRLPHCLETEPRLSAGG